MSLFKNIFLIGSSNLASQAILVLSLPILTRLFSIEDFGLYTLYGTFVTIGTLVAACRFDYIILIEKDPKKMRDIVIISFIIIFISIGLLTIFIFLSKNKLEHTIDPKKLYPILYFFPISVALGITYQILTNIFTWNRAFSSTAKSKVIQTTSQSMIQVLSGGLTLSGGLIFGRIIGVGISVIYLIKGLKNRFLFVNSITYSKMKTLINEYYKYAIFSLMGAFSNTFALQLPILLVSQTFTLVEVGLFGLAAKSVSLPSRLISTAISQVLIKEVVTLQDDKAQLIKVISHIGLINILCYFPIFLVLTFYHSEIFSTVFGSEWQTAGEISSILVMSAYLKFIVSPISVLLTTKENIKFGSAWQFSYLLGLFAVLISSKGLSLQEYVRVFVYYELVMYGIYLAIIVWRLLVSKK